MAKGPSLRLKRTDLTAEGHLTRESFENAMLRDLKHHGYTEIKFDYNLPKGQTATIITAKGPRTEEGKVALFIHPYCLDPELQKMRLYPKDWEK